MSVLLIVCCIFNFPSLFTPRSLSLNSPVPLTAASAKISSVVRFFIMAKAFIGPDWFLLILNLILLQHT